MPYAWGDLDQLKMYDFKDKREGQMQSQSRGKIGSCCDTLSKEQRNFIDPVCGMGVVGEDRSLTSEYNGVGYHFCSPHCLKVFVKNTDDILAGKYLKNKRNWALPAGIIGSSLLLLLFLTVVILANSSMTFALIEIKRLWYWVLLLASGFGLQLGLFFHIRYQVQQKMVGATAEVAASGAVSTGSMIACCSHGLVNLLPIFGISAAAAFLARYQLPFILFGVFSNLIGVTIMMGLVQKNDIKFRNTILNSLAHLNLTATRLILAVTGLVSIVLAAVMS